MNRSRPNGPDEDPKRAQRPANWGAAIDLGFRLGLSVLIGVGGGVLLDNWLRTAPLFTLLGVVVGVGAAMYSIWDVARDEMRRR